jgi:hypothetical protein
LEIRGLVAFVPDGAILPRMSGDNDQPMDDSVKEDGDNSKLVRFHSPDTLRVSFDLPNMGKTLAGIGIRKGITLIVGGGFHGKSTLLSALQVGMYNVRACASFYILLYIIICTKNVNVCVFSENTWRRQRVLCVFFNCREDPFRGWEKCQRS